MWCIIRNRCRDSGLDSLRQQSGPFRRGAQKALTEVLKVDPEPGVRDESETSPITCPGRIDSNARTAICVRQGCNGSSFDYRRLISLRRSQASNVSRFLAPSRHLFYFQGIQASLAFALDDASQVATIFVQDRSLIDESCSHFHHSKRQHRGLCMHDLRVPDWLCPGTPFAISVSGLPVEHRLTNARAHRARSKVKGS